MEEKKQRNGKIPALKPSSILEVLGPALFAAFPAVRTESTIIWCNFELARSLGFDVPQSNCMSPELHAQLLNAFSYRALRPLKNAVGKAILARQPLQPREALVGRPSVTLYADMYGGDGVSPCLGSARGGFFPYCNAFAKGIGYTPLYRHDDPDDFVHAHGGLDMHEALTEAVIGEVNVNLFERKTTRILLIFDQGDSTVYPNGKLLPRAVTIRVGNQLRPAHILAKASWTRRSRLEIFLAMTRESGQLITRNQAGEAVPDLRATILRIIDDHARMAALQIRWRTSHHFLSASNMRVDGGMLDLNTIRTNPRLPPVPPDHSLDTDRAPYTDYVDRASRIVTIYRVLRATIPAGKQRLLNAGPLDIRKEMDRAYLKHLRQQFLCAAGLKSCVADRVAQEQPGIADAFLNVLMHMTQITNPAGIEDSKNTIAEVAALDVFSLLAAYAQAYFGTNEHHSVIIQRALHPVYRGNRAQIAAKRIRVKQLIAEFIKVYRNLMEACLPFAVEHYGDAEIMRNSIRARAAFQNRPTDLLFVKSSRPGFERAIARYRTTGYIELVSGEMNHRIAASLRNIDELLHRGESQLLADGVVESQILVIDGIRYAVRSWDGTEQPRSLHVSLPLRPNEPVRGIRYRFTLDDWTTSNDVATHADLEDQTQPRLVCVIVQPACAFAELQGHFYDSTANGSRPGDKPARRGGYVFATPDPVELAEMLKNLRRP
jgi:hypothetical protein